MLHNCPHLAAKVRQLSRGHCVWGGRTARDPFIRNWLDLLAFLLSGLPANGTIAAEVVSAGGGAEGRRRGMGDGSQPKPSLTNSQPTTAPNCSI